VVIGIEGTRISIGEMGRWLGPEAKPMRHAFRVTSATRVERVGRTAQGSDGWSWSYVSRPEELSDLHPGDYVTVTVDPAERRNAAIVVEVVGPEPKALK